MKPKNYKRFKGTKQAKTLQEIVDRHEQFKGAYFWTPPGSANQRRRMEQENTAEAHFLVNGVEYQVEQSVSCSCRNVYYSLNTLVDGEPKNVRALKALLA